MKNNKVIEKPLSVVLVEDTPVGAIVIAASDIGLAYVSFNGLHDFNTFISDNTKAPDSQALEVAHNAGSQIQEYFVGKRKVFELPLDLKGVTDFRRRVLLETKNIPFGRTTTYGQLAASVKRPKAARAVGGAMAHNPLPLVIPCHRVVAGDGSMHGYSSPGGISTKVLLLRLEGLQIWNDRLVA